LNLFDLVDIENCVELCWVRGKNDLLIGELWKFEEILVSFPCTFLGQSFE
jgi:hypothetical protein